MNLDSFKHYLNINLKNIEGEQWESLSNFIGLYEVSNMGRLRSLDRIDSRGQKRLGKIMKQFISAKGYLRVCLSKNGEQIKFLSHRLVAQAFIKNPENKPHVNHLKGIKYDNRVSELCWSTRSEDELHSYSVLGKKPNKPFLGKKGKDSIFSCSVAQYGLDGAKLSVFSSYKEANEITGICTSCIGECIRGTRKTAGGYIWRKQTK